MARFEYGELAKLTTFWNFNTNATTTVPQSRRAQDALAALGMDGWEAYSVVHATGWDDPRYYLKRAF